MRKNIWKRVVCLVLLCAAFVSLLGFAGCAPKASEVGGDVSEEEIKIYTLSTNIPAVDESVTPLIIECTLEGGVLTDTLSAADFKLHYGLSSMTIDGIERLDDTRLSLTLTGEINNVYDSAQVTLLSSGIVGGDSNASVYLELLKPQVIIDYHDITMNAGTLSIPITLYQCAFVDTASAEDFSLIGMDGVEIYISDFELQGETDAILSFMADGYSDIDEALIALDKAAISGAALVIDGQALNTEEGTAIGLNIPFVHVAPDFREITLNSDGSLKVTCLLSGYSSDKMIDPSYITLGGDFVKEPEAQESSFTLTPEGETLFSFTVTADAASSDHLIAGTICLAPGAFNNPWGTPSIELVYERVIHPDDVGGVTPSTISSSQAQSPGLAPEALTNALVTPGEGLVFDHAIQNGAAEMQPVTVGLGLGGFDIFVEAIEGFTKTMEVFDSFSSLVEFGTEIATWFGWISPEEVAMEKVLNALEGLDLSISNLSTQVKSLSAETKMEGSESRVREFGSSLENLHKFVQSFDTVLEGEIRQMLVSSTAEDLLSGEIYDSLSSADKQQALDLAQAAITGYNNSVSAGSRLTKAKITEALGGGDSNAAVIVLGKAGKKIGTEFYNKEVNGNDFYTEFTSICTEVTGEGFNQSILVDLDYMADYTYNWEKEAYPVRNYYRNYIQSVLFETGELLNFCVAAYNPEMDTAALNASYNRVMTYITQGDGKTTNRDPSQTGRLLPAAYCTTLDRTVKVAEDMNTALDDGKLEEGKDILDRQDLRQIKEGAMRLGRSLLEDFTAGGLYIASDLVDFSFICARPYERIGYNYAMTVPVVERNAYVYDSGDKTSLDMESKMVYSYAPLNPGFHESDLKYAVLLFGE
ncbi:MAG: hypothetical protein LBM18_01265 [Oscillospiraceae bacterium]|jgi:hypothetical protein|nr:hypothetical protein [Oscillospiraceae bacterium]